MSAMKTKKWMAWCVVGFLLGGSLAMAAEKGTARKAAAPSDPTHSYYVFFKGLKKAGQRTHGIFEAQAEWTLRGGLKKLEPKKIEIPAESDDEGYWREGLAKGGWYAARRNGGSRLDSDPGGLKRGYPHPFFFHEDLRGMGTSFEAIVEEIIPTDEGASVQLALLGEIKHGSDEETAGAKTRAKKPAGAKREVVTVPWKNSVGPVPVATGQKLTAHVTDQRAVLLITYTAAPRYWRKAPEGKVEIAYDPGVEAKGSPPGLVLLRPTGLVGSASANWIPGLGVFLYEEAAGPALLPSAPKGGDKAGIQLINVPGVRLQPGRDGWKRAKMSEDGFWDDCPPVPEDQKTASAG